MGRAFAGIRIAAFSTPSCVDLCVERYRVFALFQLIISTHTQTTFNQLFASSVLPTDNYEVWALAVRN
jgi:hypothetical protein